MIDNQVDPSVISFTRQDPSASITKEEGIVVLDNIIQVIQENKQYLSDIDGAIGDGDHGINMNKGFSMCREELDNNPGDLSHGLNLLSRVLMI